MPHLYTIIFDPSTGNKCFTLELSYGCSYFFPYRRNINSVIYSKIIIKGLLCATYY